MTTGLLILGGSVLLVAVLSRLVPGKTDKDLVFDADEVLLYDGKNLRIRFYSLVGRGVRWPGSRIQVTNKRVVFSQKALVSDKHVIHSIGISRANPPERLKNTGFWGLVTVYPYDQTDFSVTTTEDGQSMVIFKNALAPNMARMEITSIPDVGAFTQALDRAAAGR